MFICNDWLPEYVDEQQNFFDYDKKDLFQEYGTLFSANQNRMIEYQLCQFSETI